MISSLRLPVVLLTLAAVARAQTPVTPQVQPAADFTQKATEACTDAMTDETLNKLLDPAPFIKNCVDDCKLTGVLTFVSGHKAAYLAKAKALQAPAPAAIAPAAGTAAGAALDPLADKYTKACTAALADAALNKVLDPAPFVKNCVADAKLSGGLDELAGAKANYLAKAKALALPAVATKFHADVTAFKKNAGELVAKLKSASKLALPLRQAALPALEAKHKALEVLGDKLKAQAVELKDVTKLPDGSKFSSEKDADAVTAALEQMSDASSSKKD